MIRVSYWQFRLPLSIVLGGLAVVAVIAGLAGPALAHLYDTTVATCKGGLCEAALSAAWQNPPLQVATVVSYR